MGYVIVGVTFCILGFFLGMLVSSYINDPPKGFLDLDEDKDEEI